MGEQKDRMLRGELCRADDPELIAERRNTQIFLARFNAIVPGGGWKEDGRPLLLELLGELGTDAVIERPFRCDYGRQIAIGCRSVLTCSFGQTFSSSRPRIRSTPRHGVAGGKRRTRSPSATGRGLGGGVIVCPGVTIGAETVVGAGSVVTRDLPPRLIAAGNPCRVIRRLDA